MGSAVGRPIGRPRGLRRLFARQRRKAPTQSSVKVPQPLADPTIHEVDTPLVGRLRDVYVDTSSTTITQENPFASERMRKPDNLPKDRRVSAKDTFTLTTASSAGFVSYAEVLEILNARETERNGGLTAEVVAEMYKIEPLDAENLMKYFSAYKVSNLHQSTGKT